MIKIQTLNIKNIYLLLKKEDRDNMKISQVFERLDNLDDQNYRFHLVKPAEDAE